MKVTCEPRSIRLASGSTSRLATASILLDDAFVVRNLSVMSGKNGIFVSMPQRKGVDKDGKEGYFDTSFPTTAELRTQIQDAVIGAYKEKLNELQNAAIKDDSQQASEPAEEESDFEPEMY